MPKKLKETLHDRVFTMALGALSGLVYGFVIAVLVALVSEEFFGSMVILSAAVFAAVGFMHGNIVLETLLATLHFITGFSYGISRNHDLEPEHETQPHLRAFALLGFYTGLIFLLFYCWY